MKTIDEKLKRATNKIKELQKDIKRTLYLAASIQKINEKQEKEIKQKDIEYTMIEAVIMMLISDNGELKLEIKDVLDQHKRYKLFANTTIEDGKKYITIKKEKEDEK